LEAIQQAGSSAPPVSVDVYRSGAQRWFDVHVQPTKKATGVTFRDRTDHQQ
jgi:hypothetical protein